MRTRSRIEFRRRDAERRAVQGRMREQAIDGALEIAAIGRNGLGDIGDHFRRHGKTPLPFARGGDARLQNLDAQPFVQRFNVEAKTAL